jgi:transcriptional regulator with XRE-family HTH domain
MLVSRAQLGLKVAQIRERLGLTQGELAERAKLSVELVAEVEEGKVRIAGRDLNRLAEALGVSELDLLRRPLPGYILLKGD